MVLERLGEGGDLFWRLYAELLSVPGQRRVDLFRIVERGVERLGYRKVDGERLLGVAPDLCYRLPYDVGWRVRCPERPQSAGFRDLGDQPGRRRPSGHPGLDYRMLYVQQLREPRTYQGHSTTSGNDSL